MRDIVKLLEPTVPIKRNKENYRKGSLKRHLIMLPDDLVKIAIEAGDGNKSQGIRKILREYESNLHKPST
jgi:hypothetical protein